eukprot:1195871-Prorocentrum_minimum.AAC.3
MEACAIDMLEGFMSTLAVIGTGGPAADYRRAVYAPAGIINRTAWANLKIRSTPSLRKSNKA